MASGERNLGGVGHPSRVFAYEWQGKDLRDRESVRAANKGVTKTCFCAFAHERMRAERRKVASGEWRVARKSGPELTRERESAVGRAEVFSRQPFAKGALGKREALRKWRAESILRGSPRRSGQAV